MSIIYVPLTYIFWTRTGVNGFKWCQGASRASKYICPAQPGIYEFRAAVRVAHEALNKYMPRVPKARVVYMFRRTRGPVYKVYIPESAEHGNKLIS